MQTHELDRSQANASFQNRILGTLSKPLLEKLAPNLTRVELPQGFVLVKPEREIQWVYFLERGMASVSSLDRAGTPVEVCVIGREGIVGIQALLGWPRTHTAAIMQGAGEGYRVRVEALREVLLEFPELLDALHAFLYLLLEQTTQLVLCNRLHELEARLARWLLMTGDFVGTKAIPLTQEYLAEMLGVGRPAVTLAAGVLQRNGSIIYSRGLAEIADAQKLRQTSCECYQVIRKAYERVHPKLF